MDLEITTIILASAILTYLVRAGGYVLMTRVKSVPPRIEAALDAVPAAVLTTLVAPVFFTGGWDIKIAMLTALLVSLRFPGIIMLVCGWLMVVAIRHFTSV